MLYRRKSEVVVVYLVMLALAIVGAFTSDVFFTAKNLRNILSANVGLLFITFAQLVIITLGGVDLSTGSIISLVNVMAVTMMKDSVSSLLLTVLLCLLTGFVIGLLNGLLVVKGDMQPIIATLATQTVFAGVTLLIMSAPDGTLPYRFCKFITKGWGYLFPVLLMILITAGMWLLMYRTNFGRNLFCDRRQ